MRKKSLSGTGPATGSDPALLLVHVRLQALGGLEGQDAARGDLDLAPGLRVPPLAGGLLADAEVPEADDLHVVPLLEGLEHDVEDRLDDRGRLPLGEPVRGDSVDQVILGQACHLPSSSPTRTPTRDTAQTRRPPGARQPTEPWGGARGCGPPAPPPGRRGS